MIDNTLNQTNILGEDKVFFSSEHESIYETSINIFKDNFLFGVGPKMFRIHCAYPKYKQRFGCSTHSHNTYVQLLVETGIIGFIFFATIFLIVVYVLTKQVILETFFNKSICL